MGRDSEFNKQKDRNYRIKLEEINRFFLPEHFSVVEKVSYILKKGYLSQKETLIKNLHIKIDNGLI